MNCKICKADCCSRGKNRDAAFCAGWEKMTNADRIRSFSDEELADLFNRIETDGKAYGPIGKAQWLKRLKQEVEE